MSRGVRPSLAASAMIMKSTKIQVIVVSARKKARTTSPRT